ncbi:MAG TPA: enoyl-CoA hydratase [Alphaproteobacteria bacterium]|nr:enoyl-CoA hydratase [Alphaproteobacteria bacterium]
MSGASGEALVLAERDGAVLRLTLNRPGARNALSKQLMSALEEELASSAADDSVSVIVLAANGPAFCAGHDLREMNDCRASADKGEAAFAAIFAQCSWLMQMIVRHPVPIIAEVQDVATAAGVQLVASCDLAIASTSARFATPGVNIGLFCSTPMVALSRNVARKHAMEMLLTGELVSAEEAARIGLINRAVAPADLKSETMKLARLVASKPHGAIKIGKEAFYRQLEMGLAEAYEYASRIMTENMLNTEACEGIGAFLEKRKPDWR